MFELVYTPIAHEVLPVSLVDSVTAKVEDEKTPCIHYIHLIYLMLYTFFACLLDSFYTVFVYILYTFYIHLIHIEGQDERQKVATRKVEDGQKTLFPRIVR